MTVAVALIVKNEELTLPRCLASVEGAVDEIVVVDTGSDDRTMEVAAACGARVFDFTWRDDFAAARQFAFDQVTTDWVFWLDADDVVLGADNIRRDIAAATDDVHAFYWRYVLGRDVNGEPTYTYWRERCVRTGGTHRWVGRVHEVLVAHTAGAIVRSESVVVEHHPDPARTSHSGRNLRILDDEYRAQGGKLEPRMLFYLGRELADNGQPHRAIEILEQCVREGGWDDERYLAQIRVAELCNTIAEPDRAIDAYLSALKIHPTWPDAYFGLAAIYYFRQDWPKVKHWADIGRSLPPPETLLFVNRRAHTFDWLIYYTNALYHLGDVEAALAWTRHALNLAPDDTWHRHNLTYFQDVLTARGVTPAITPVAEFSPFTPVAGADQTGQIP
jgi:glycosyltransferase involved in cell wall biosynthesis